MNTNSPPTGRNQGFGRGHLYIAGWVLGSFALFNLVVLHAGLSSLKAALGPFVIVGEEGWRNGFSDYSLRIAVAASLILVGGLLVQLLARPRWFGLGGRYITWALCLFVWCFSGYLSAMGQMG